MEAENATFLKRLGLCLAPVVLTTGIGLASGDSEGPLYVGLRPSKLEQEHSFTVGPLHIQYGRIINKDPEITYRGGR